MEAERNAIGILFLILGTIGTILAIILGGYAEIPAVCCDSSCPVGALRVCGVGPSIVGTLPILNNTTTSEIIGSNIFISNNGKTITTEGELRFQNSSSYVGFAPPPTIPLSSVIWSLPASDGKSGEFLQTNGTGALTWAAGGGSSTTDFADNVFYIYDDANMASRIYFKADAIKGTDRTFVAPDADGILPATTKSNTNLMLGETNYITLQNNTGKNNTIIGFNCGNQITDGNRNTALGDTALNQLQKGNDNTAFGYQALTRGGSDNNTAFGSRALESTTNGTNNVANGTFALSNNTTGRNNTATGHRALIANDKGNDNTGIGFNALSKIATGNSNTAIGSGADVDSDSRNNCIIIGNGAISDTTDNTVTIGNENVRAQIVSGGTGPPPVSMRRISIKIGNIVYTLLADP
jgi:hypothetical protein